jgi:RNA polymerase subunit RPABC4/transcription elongation factor Spt4
VRVRKLVWSQAVIEKRPRGVQGHHRSGDDGSRTPTLQEEETMKLPRFRSEDAEAAFWETHDFSEYLDELEEVQLEWAPDEDTCPSCGATMNAEQFEVEVVEGLCLRNLRRYRCPVCHTTQLAPESLARINHADSLIKRFGLAGLLLQKELGAVRA